MLLLQFENKKRQYSLFSNYDNSKQVRTLVLCFLSPADAKKQTKNKECLFVLQILSLEGYACGPQSPPKVAVTFDVHVQR